MNHRRNLFVVVCAAWIVTIAVAADYPTRPIRLIVASAPGGNPDINSRNLASELSKIPQVTITQKVEANGVFAILTKKYVPLLQQHYFFYVWNEEISEVRFMTSFDTTEADIADFIALVKKTVK